MADDAVNGVKVNATIYYVLSQTPTPLHSVHPVDVARRNELQSSLAYLEGCYGGLPTLQATNLWKSLDSQEEVNRLVSLWLLTLYKNVSVKKLVKWKEIIFHEIFVTFSGMSSTC